MVYKLVRYNKPRENSLIRGLNLNMKNYKHQFKPSLNKLLNEDFPSPIIQRDFHEDYH